MGKKPDQVERDINAQRANITAHVEGLQKRVRDDLDTAQAAAKGRVNDAVQGTKQTLKPDNLLEEHPISGVAGAMAIGVVLGIAGNGHNDGHSSRSSRQHNGSGSGDGALSGLLASVLSPAAHAAQQELQGLVREGFSALKEQANQVASNATGDPYRQNRDLGVE